MKSWFFLIIFFSFSSPETVLDNCALSLNSNNLSKFTLFSIISPFCFFSLYLHKKNSFFLLVKVNSEYSSIKSIFLLDISELSYPLLINSFNSP